MQASPSTGQPSKDVLLIKCLELGVVIGMAMACCSVRPYLIDYMFHGSPSTNFDQGGRQKKIFLNFYSPEKQVNTCEHY